MANRRSHASTRKKRILKEIRRQLIIANSFPFLRLPAELRNTIYELALTAPKPLSQKIPVRYHEGECGECERVEERPFLYHYDEPDDPVTGSPSPIEFNQLKYVNKQIYAETVGLELKYNDIALDMFVDRGGASPAERLVEWLSSMPTTKRSWIKTISVKVTFHTSIPRREQPRIPDRANTIARLTRLCNDNPSMTVKYYLPSCKLEHYRFRSGLFFFIAADHICHALRGKGYGEFFKSDSSSVTAKLWRQEVKGAPTRLEDLQAKNLRYFPTLPRGDCVPIMKEDFLWARNEHIPEAEQWVGNKYLKEWIEHGI
jgi:hypothetical protein